MPSFKNDKDDDGFVADEQDFDELREHSYISEIKNSSNEEQNNKSDNYKTC